MLTLAEWHLQSSIQPKVFRKSVQRAVLAPRSLARIGDETEIGAGEELEGGRVALQLLEGHSSAKQSSRSQVITGGTEEFFR